MMRQRVKVPEEKGHYAECVEFYTKCSIFLWENYETKGDGASLAKVPSRAD